MGSPGRESVRYEVMNATHKTVGGTRRPLRVLLVEDSRTDALLLTGALERGGFAVTSERVDTPEACEDLLEKGQWDLILCDHSMPRFSAPAALEIVKRRGLDIPFIIVSGYIEEETAVAAMKAGAHDYIMKDRLARLVPAVDRELREAEVRRARRKSEEELRRAHEELEERVEQRTVELRTAYQKLEKVVEERKRLENELLEIAENERRRIGFDLHDDLGQKLTGLSLMIKGLTQQLAAQRHNCLSDGRKIENLMDDIISHTHNLAHQFSSMDVKGKDLPAMMKGLARNVEKMFKIGCAFSARGALPVLPQDIILQLYKIAQEAVSNAIKHGKARHVSIGLRNENDLILMTVRNDGLPFVPPASSKDRMGLRIMNYRASTIGATLEVRPAEKSGTLVSCALILKNARKIAARAAARPGKRRVETRHEPRESVSAVAP
jgi:signal transduction histidine kinase